jgi:hypothetical protein
MIAGSVDGVDLTPLAEYIHPMLQRPIAPATWAPGALQLPAAATIR